MKTTFIDGLSGYHSEKSNANSFITTPECPGYHTMQLLTFALRTPVLLDGNVYEIFGSSGCGKTQLGLGVAADVLVAKEHSTVLYFCSENRFPSSRFHDLLRSSLASSRGSAPPENDVIDASKRLLVAHTMQTEDMLALLRHHPANSSVSLLVVDSIAALFVESETSASASGGGANEQVKAVDALKRFGKEFSCPIIVLNQARSHATSQQTTTTTTTSCTAKREVDELFTDGDGQGDDVYPALGYVWRCCVTASLRLRPIDAVVKFVVNETSTSNEFICELLESCDHVTTTIATARARRLAVAYAPTAPSGNYVDFFISEIGLHLLTGVHDIFTQSSNHCANVSIPNE